MKLEAGNSLGAGRFDEGALGGGDVVGVGAGNREGEFVDDDARFVVAEFTSSE